MSLRWKKLSGAFVLYFTALLTITYGIQQNHFLYIFSAYTVAFLAYLYLISGRNELGIRNIQILAIILLLVPLFSTPTLSPDVYRFLWDGELTTLGIHPYAYKPMELIGVNQQLIDSEYMNFLYDHMTDLSKQNFSVYPSVNQVYFFVVAVLSDDLISSLLFLRFLILFTLVWGGKFLIKTLRLLSIPVNNSALLFFNPLLIVEVLGNFHFEGVMLSWLIIGIYYLLKNKVLKSSLFWAIAINIKLTPLILLPFLIRFKGFKMSLKFYILIFLFSGILLFVYLWPSVFLNFMQSIELYFNNFEFNAGIFHGLKWITSCFIDGNPTLILGPLLSILAFVLILFIAFYHPINTPKEWFKRMMWGYVIYLLLSTTVHPWYLILPLGMVVFTNNLAILFWSYLIFLSYAFYAFGSSIFGYSIIALEYIILIVLLLSPSNSWFVKLRKWLRLELMK